MNVVCRYPIFTCLRKHRQALLNSAHLLRLYHQSSKEAIEIINKTKRIPKIKTEIIGASDSEILRNNGLRLLWDALDNLELLRATLILEYLENRCAGLMIKLESLKNFKSNLTRKIIQVLTKEQTDGVFVYFTTLALILTSSNQLIEYFKSELSKDLILASIKIINFYNNLKISTPKPFESIRLFAEQESNFCEYPQLESIKSRQVPSFDILELKNNIKILTNNFFTVNFEQLPSIDPELLKGLELEEQLINNILKKVNAKGNTEKLRYDLSDLFDKLMKFIQSIIRSNSAIVVDELLKTKFSLICENLEHSNFPSEELETILKSFDQTILNKSNIIFTIHKNEISTLNSKRELPIPSKIYLASNLCYILVKPFSTCNGESAKLFVKYIEQINKKFYEMWLNDIMTKFNELKGDNNELFALIWLSDSFLTLQITNECKSNALKFLSLDTETVRNKYFAQSALLTGLFEPEKISTPKLQTSTNSESARELLPHFISL